MNLNLKKTHFLCAGATGLWLLASKAYAQSTAATEKALANDEDALFDAAKEGGAGLHERSALPRSFSPAFSEESLRLNSEGIPECLSPAPSTSQQPSSPGVIVLTSSNAMQQLTNVMPFYHEEATYEDNFLSLTGARSIFYHFLTLICFFFKVEVFVKNVKSELVENNKGIVYTADCIRRYVIRPVPLIHLFLPEAITCEVQTVCHVDEGCVVRHEDIYTKMNLSWKLKIPSLWVAMKTLAGLVYTYLLNAIYLAFDLGCIAINKLGLESNSR